MATELEPTAPAPVVTPVAVPEQPPPVATTPPAPDPDEAQAIDVQGGKMVPLPALKAAREDTRAAKEAAATLQQQVAQLQGQLTAFQEVQRTLAQSRAEAMAPTSPQVDPDLVDLARSLDYYKSDGTPDLARAQKHADLIQKQATKIAQQMIAPLHQQTARTQSDANLVRALQVQSPQGTKPRPETLQWMWQNLPPEYTADPRVAQALPALALGLETLQGNGSRLPAQPAPPSGPPLVTEPVGGVAPRHPVRISEAERAVMSARGIDDKQYETLTKGFVPGRVSSLED